MKLNRITPPRTFEAGGDVRLTHVADIELESDELVTFRAGSGSELDITRKDWGYYGSPSLNGRLRAGGLRAALATGGPEPPRMYLVLVEEGQEEAFDAYLEGEGMSVVAWLDSDEAVAEAARRLAGP